MRIVTLIENSPGDRGCAFEHGLSLYVETERHRLLMDTGAGGAFLGNAEKLGIDLGRVDTVILSHGHYDHTGGVRAFAAVDPQAVIYLRANADGAFYHGEKYIGIDRAILSLPRLRKTEGSLVIDDELSLFTDVTGSRCRPESNLELSRRDPDGSVRQDDFSHEQYLVIREGGRHVLLSGCAHNGILNILDRYRALYHGDPDLVISGFHMKKNAEYTDAELRTIRSIAAELKRTDAAYYTGHCTGDPAFGIMREIMGDQLKRIRSGDEIIF
ncbi:MAG: MBL fold metallo-hydrolase [Clostridia bacterium]|nr:MBL fold metallo-hydrolase [Clostridia bacterium]